MFSVTLTFPPALQHLRRHRELLCELASQTVTISLMLFQSVSHVEMHHVLSRRAALAFCTHQPPQWYHTVFVFVPLVFPTQL